MALFSDRYGYTTPREVLRREVLDTECTNALCTCYDYLSDWLNNFDREGYHNGVLSYVKMEEHIWCFFLNNRKDDFWEYNSYKIVATSYLSDYNYPWYKKFNLIEFTLNYLKSRNPENKTFQYLVQAFIKLLNQTFVRLDLAYRIVDYQVVEISNDEEIISIENAMITSDNIRTHLSRALQHLSNRPTADYRNSIKESISAVEVLCRSITNENTLGKALNKLISSGIVFPKMLKEAFDKLYAYTNNETTGIRHALIEDSENPGFDEAKFMLITCSAFINYIGSKHNTKS